MGKIFSPSGVSRYVSLLTTPADNAESTGAHRAGLPASCREPRTPTRGG